MKTKILVIEDDSSISELICMNLEAAGYEAIPIMDGLAAERFIRGLPEHGGSRSTASGGKSEQEARSTASGGKSVQEAQSKVAGETVLQRAQNSGEIALALVDVMLPGKDGFALMEDLQAKNIPVIYLTAKDDVLSKVHGLKSGAEDYIVKPFEVLELLVRMEKVLKRTGRGREKIQIRDVVIDLKQHSVTKGGARVSLKPMEYELLVTLAGSKNVAFSREELLNRIWGVDYMGETRTVDVHIGQLRKKLDFYDVIRTISKTGYRLEDLQ
ncbi:MAG: response regulator transcription factor [Clostridium sp.]|nr:response regulator transcription factor [Clostridium sp.]